MNLGCPAQQAAAETNLNLMLAAAMSREVAEAMPPVEEAIRQADRVVVLPEGTGTDFEVEWDANQGQQLG